MKGTRPGPVPTRRERASNRREPVPGWPRVWTIAGIFLWALVLRLIYVHQVSTNPSFDSPTMDPLYHDQWARAIAAGKPWLKNDPYFRAPFYPYFLAFVYRFLDAGYLLPRVIQAGLGALAAVFVYLVARRAFGERAGIVSGIIAGCYWTLIYFDGELLINVFENLFNLMLLWLLFRAMDRDRGRDWLLAGAMLGLSAIARPTILTVGLAIVPWMWWACGRRGFVLRAAAFAAGAALLVLPVTVRNLVVGHDVVPIAWQGGINFYLGNHEGADGWSATGPGIPLDWWGGYYKTIEIAEEARGHHLKPSAISDYWFERGASFLRSDPAAGFRLWARKLALFWTSYEFGNNQVVYFFERYAPILRLPLPRFGLIAPLGLAGMVLFTRGPRRTLLTLFVLVYMVTIVAFFVCDKLRLPVVPVLIMFASAFAVRVWEELRAHRVRPAAQALALVVPFALLVNLDLARVPRPSFAQSHASMGSILLQKGRYAEAEREFRDSIAIDPQFPSAHLNLGVALLELGRRDEAMEEYRKEIALGRDDPRPYSNLGFLLQQAGKYDEAIELYRKSLALKPKDGEVAYNLASCLVRSGRPAEAEPYLREVLAADPANLNALNNLAVALAQQGQYDEAIRMWEQVLSKNPAFPQARDNIESARRSRERAG